MLNLFGSIGGREKCAREVIGCAREKNAKESARIRDSCGEEPLDIQSLVLASSTLLYP
jgi:hypothetical protein